MLLSRTVKCSLTQHRTVSADLLSSLNTYIYSYYKLINYLSIKRASVETCWKELQLTLRCMSMALGVKLVCTVFVVRIFIMLIFLRCDNGGWLYNVPLKEIAHNLHFHIVNNNTLKKCLILAMEIFYQFHSNYLKNRQNVQFNAIIKLIEILRFTDKNYSKRSSNSVVIVLHPFPTYMPPDVT